MTYGSDLDQPARLDIDALMALDLQANAAPMRSHWLLVEDEEDVGTALQDFLGLHGVSTTLMASAATLGATLRDGAFDGVLLDQFVGGLDLSLRLVALRKIFGGPILMLTGNTDPVDRILCLGLGADDFILKSVPPRELLARIHAVLRRTRKAPVTAALRSVTVDGWMLTHTTRVLSGPQGSSLPLTPSERDVMWLLMERVGTCVSRDDTSHKLYGHPQDSGDRTIDNLVSRCRKRVATLGWNLDVDTIRGKGYLLRGFKAVRPNETVGD